MKRIALLFQLPVISSLCAAATLLFSAGCASPAQSKGMLTVGFKVARQHPVSVIVQTEGGAKTEETGMPAISASAFREALVAAINESRVFSAIREQPPADYRLLLRVVSATPSGAFTMHGTVSTRWQLTRLIDNSVLFNEFVTTSGKATSGEAFVGFTRMRIALERAGQENIKQGLTKLSELDLH